MKTKDIKNLVKPYRIRDGEGFRLRDIDPGDTGGLKSEGKRETREWLQHGIDVDERKHWDDYMEAYGDMIRHTSQQHAPWFVVPADNKWFSQMIVGAALIDALEEMNLAFPELDAAKRKELQEIREALATSGKNQKRKTDVTQSDS